MKHTHCDASSLSCIQRASACLAKLLVPVLGDGPSHPMLAHWHTFASTFVSSSKLSIGSGDVRCRIFHFVLLSCKSFNTFICILESTPAAASETFWKSRGLS